MLSFPALSRDLNAINDNGAIKGMDAREDGVYITYVPSSGADSVTKKLGSEPQLLGTLTGNGTFDCKKIANYKQLIHDTTFWQSFGHNIYLVIACIIGQIGIAFILVLMVNAKSTRLKGIHRTFGFFPSTIAAVCIGLIWNMIYHNKYGLINWFLKAIGRQDLCQVWLNNSKIVMLCVTIPLIWQFIGYYMVIILSAIASIDTEIFESAQIDGANGIQTAWYITLPLIKNTMLVCITLCVAGNMKAFDNIYVMTKGGPGTASMVMAMYGYQVSFSQSNMGYGSCISVAIFVLSLLVIGGSQGLIKYLTREKEA